MNVLKKILPFFLMVFGVGILVIVAYFAIEQLSSPISYFQPVDSRDGAELYKKELPNGNRAYLQVIDVQKMQIDQLIGEVDRMAFKKGLYYQGENKYYSPFFKSKLFSEVTEEYKKLYGNGIFSVINCSFFEQYKRSTQLSFPIKFNGQVITGGNGTYGPVKKPKDGRYKNVRLKALVWNDREAYITNYEPKTGKPLNQKEVQNAVVTYEYKHHPAKLLSKNPANRYHVIGTLDKDGRKGNELLAIITVNEATLDLAAKLLREFGVKGDIVTIDGGASTYLFNPKIGEIMLPKSNNFATRELPHYLGFRSRKSKPALPKILVSKPAEKVQVEANKPYLILWRDNIQEQVKIELYEENKSVQSIANSASSDGVYEWKPKIAVKPGSLIRISSVKNAKVSGAFQL
ncbi:MAG: hypothetical protein EAZ09_10555 [Oscillatoriales cyanobacterium]|nr:MAG: hypothetical protein EAZ18_04530 [Oscillatoriales cyanobacterium]TAH22386.1 MAG: hypothetical protein EAZ09_10555 [Oscillatoriales cyanobacterium]